MLRVIGHGSVTWMICYPFRYSWVDVLDGVCQYFAVDQSACQNQLLNSCLKLGFESNMCTKSWWEMDKTVFHQWLLHSDVWKKVVMYSKTILKNLIKHSISAFPDPCPCPCPNKVAILQRVFSSMICQTQSEKCLKSSSNNTVCHWLQNTCR